MGVVERELALSVFRRGVRKSIFFQLANVSS